MPSLYHEVLIKAEVAEVFRAIDTSERLQIWWTPNVEHTGEIRSTSTFYFNNKQSTLQMKINDRIINSKIVWQCIGKIEEWLQTRITWEFIETEKPNYTLLKLSHEGWLDTKGSFALCNTTWGALLFNIKKLCENQNPSPLFA